MWHRHVRRRIGGQGGAHLLGPLPRPRERLGQLDPQPAGVVAVGLDDAEGRERGVHRRPRVQAPERRGHLAEHRRRAHLLGRHEVALDEPRDQDLLRPQVGEHLRADAQAAGHHRRRVLGLAVGAQHLGLAGDAQDVLLRRAVDAVVEVGQPARQRLGPQRIPAQVGDALGDPRKVVGRRRIRHLERSHAAYDTPSPPAHSHRAQATAGWWSPRRPAIRSARIERFLAGHGFGGADPPAGMLADLYLGYGLAACIAGVHEPQPPEPCPLPLAACRVRPADGTHRRRGRSTPARSCPPGRARRARRGGGAGARGDRPRRRLPGEPGAAPAGAVSRLAAGARGGARAARRRLGARRSTATAGRSSRPRPSSSCRRAATSPATMPIKGTRPAGDAASRSPASAEGPRRARDDRRPRAQRPRPRLPPRQRARGRVPGRAADGRRAPHGLDRRGAAAPGRRPGRAPARDLPRRLGHRRAQAGGDRPHRPARAGRPRRVDGRARRRPPQRRPRPRPHDPHGRRRRRRPAPVGRRRHRVGLRPGRRGRGVAREGAAAGAADRRRAPGRRA